MGNCFRDARGPFPMYIGTQDDNWEWLGVFLVCFGVFIEVIFSLYRFLYSMLYHKYACLHPSRDGVVVVD